MTDIDFAPGEALTGDSAAFADGSAVDLREGDVCIMTNACMTDSAVRQPACTGSGTGTKAGFRWAVGEGGGMEAAGIGQSGTVLRQRE